MWPLPCLLLSLAQAVFSQYGNLLMSAPPTAPSRTIPPVTDIQSRGRRPLRQLGADVLPVQQHLPLHFLLHLVLRRRRTSLCRGTSTLPFHARPFRHTTTIPSTTRTTTGRVATTFLPTPPTTSHPAFSDCGIPGNRAIPTDTEGTTDSTGAVSQTNVNRATGTRNKVFHSIDGVNCWGRCLSTKLDCLKGCPLLVR